MFEMLRLEVLRPSELSDADIGAWRDLCAGRPQFRNPLLGPDFAIAVGAVREDARVAVWREGDKAIGFLAHHRRPGGMARPIGAPLSDYHGLVADRRLDIRHDLAEFGLSAFRFTGLVDPDGDFAAAVAGTSEAYVIELDHSAQAYLETLRAASAKRFKNYRRLDGKLDREVGALTLRAPDHDRAAFDQLLAWKRQQLDRTGAHDFLAPQWTRDLLASFLDMREGPFQGLMINLYCGDRLLAGHIDAAVLDANLNGLAVTPVAEALAARGVPFVFATGYGDSGAPMGFDAPIIRKPYDVTQVAAAVSGLLGTG